MRFYFDFFRYLKVVYWSYAFVVLTYPSTGQGCKVTAHDLRPIPARSEPYPNLFVVTGNISDENSVKSCIAAGKRHPGMTDESDSYLLWKIPLELWEKTYNTNLRGTSSLSSTFFNVQTIVRTKWRRAIGESSYFSYRE